MSRRLSLGLSCSFGPKMRTPDEVFIDFKARKNGILSALCEDQDAFFSACDPASENLCLYGNPDGSWVGIRCLPLLRLAVAREPAKNFS